MALFGRDSNLNSRVSRSRCWCRNQFWSDRCAERWNFGWLENLLVRDKNFLQFRKLSYERGKLFELKSIKKKDYSEFFKNFVNFPPTNPLSDISPSFWFKNFIIKIKRLTNFSLPAHLLTKRGEIVTKLYLFRYLWVLIPLKIVLPN